MATSKDALAFVRVSTGSQDESTQVTTLDKYAGEHDITIVDTWKLHGYSASAGEQDPDLRRAIEGIERGRWHLILVTDSSRLDRREDLDVQAEVLLSIRQAGGDVLSVSEPQFGKTDFAGRIVTLTAQYANAEKSRTVKTQTWRGVQAIISHKAMYGHVPVFWDTDGDRFAKVAFCADPKAVHEVYEWIKAGKSLSGIARKYDTYPKSIRTLVRTRANMTGEFDCRYTYQGELYTWTHTAAGTPPVDSELWHAANRVMTERGAMMDNTGGRPVNKPMSWISGILPCPGIKHETTGTVKRGKREFLVKRPVLDSNGHEVPCDGHLSVMRDTLRCTGHGKDRVSCGVSGIPLDYVSEQIEEIVARDDVRVYRFQRVSGNAGELDELKAELARVKDSLDMADRTERRKLMDRWDSLEEDIANFKLVPETYDMVPTDETLADLWRSGDKRQIMTALQRYIGFNVGWGRPEVNGYVWIESYYPADTLIEITDDLAVKMEYHPRYQRTPEQMISGEWPATA